MEEEKTKKAISKEIGRISRTFLEISIENYRCLTSCVDFLTKKGSSKSQEFIREAGGLLQWLSSITEFSKYVKKHVQDGRLALMNYLGEKQAFVFLNELQSKRLDKKSTLLTQLDLMLQGILELKQPQKDERDTQMVANKRESLFDKFVKKIEPDFITIQQEPLDIVHLKDERYLIGSYDGSLMLKDVQSPKNDLTFRQHLNNRATWIRSIIRDNESKVWVATSNELTVYDKSFKIVMQTRSYNPTVKFYGHFKILWTDRKGQYIFWWCDRDAIKIFHSRTLKLMSKVKGLIKNSEERPNHYTFLDGSYKKMLIITNKEPMPNKFYIVDVLRRRVQNEDSSFPKIDQSLKFSYLCMAYNCPSACIVTTGVCARFSPNKQMVQRTKENEMPHLTVYRLTSDHQLTYVDHYFNADLKHMNNSAVVFHQVNHSRLLAVQTTDIVVIDLINDKLQVLFVIRDINRGEVVHQLIRLRNSYLFVGNYGQIFKVDFSPKFFNTERVEEQSRSRSEIADIPKRDLSSGRTFQLMGNLYRKPVSSTSFPDTFPMNHSSPGPIGGLKELDRKQFDYSHKDTIDRRHLPTGAAGFSLDHLERPSRDQFMTTPPHKPGFYDQGPANLGRQYPAWSGSYGEPQLQNARRPEGRRHDDEDQYGGLKRFKNESPLRYSER